MGVDQKKLPSYSSFIGTVLIRIPFISFTLLHLTSPVCCHALHPSGAQEMRGIFGSCTSTRFMTSRWGCSNWRPVKSLKWPVSSDKLNTHWGYCHLRKQINWAAQPLEGWTDANVWMDKWNQIFGSRPSKDNGEVVWRLDLFQALLDHRGQGHGHVEMLANQWRTKGAQVGAQPASPGFVWFANCQAANGSIINYKAKDPHSIKHLPQRYTWPAGLC